ncbi:TPA: hypothetical protein ACH3X1_004120 [Trebouxia sp. C0004]
MSQLQLVDESPQETQQTGSAYQSSARRGTIRNRASFLLPNGQGNWSLLRGEASIPKTATEQEVIIEHYDQMVSMLQDPNFRSKYVTVIDSEPQTPT